MYLYDKKSNDNITVYSMTPKKRDIKAYRLVSMHDNPFCEFIVRDITKNYDDIYSLDKGKDKIITDISFMLRRLKNCTNSHCSEFKMDFYEIFDLMEEYYNNFDPQKYQICYIKDAFESFALIGKSFDYRKSSRRISYIGKDETIYITDNLIKIPINLYLIEILLKGNFNLIREYDLTEQLKLFNYSEITSISFDNVKQFQECGMLASNLDFIEDKIKEDATVINKVKELKLV